MIKTSEKLRLIQKLSDLSQQELANIIGVSFVAFNAWINDRSLPRKSALGKIDELYKEYTGQKIIPDNVLNAKKKLIETKSKKNKSVLSKIFRNKDIFEKFILSLTYNSNKIEGSTLSEADTASIIFDGITLSNKTLVEQMEAKNHQAALEFLLNHIKNKASINEDFVLRIHGILMNSIIPDAGFYRRHGVRITGSNVITANYLKIPDLMTNLFIELNGKSEDIIHKTARLHALFEQIHPFADGNGRTGRLLILAQLLENNYAPAIINQSKKRLYITYLNKAQLKADTSLLEDFLCDSILEGYNILERKF